MKTGKFNLENSQIITNKEVKYWTTTGDLHLSEIGIYSSVKQIPYFSMDNYKTILVT